MQDNAAHEAHVARGKDGHLTLDSIHRGGSPDFFSAKPDNRSSKSGEVAGGWGAGEKPSDFIFLAISGSPRIISNCIISTQ